MKLDCMMNVCRFTLSRHNSSGEKRSRMAGDAKKDRS